MMEIDRNEAQRLTFRGRTPWSGAGTEASIACVDSWRLQVAVIGLLRGLGRHGFWLLAR